MYRESEEISFNMSLGAAEEAFFRFFLHSCHWKFGECSVLSLPFFVHKPVHVDESTIEDFGTLSRVRFSVSVGH